MATKKSGNGSKRQSPSRERLLALALVRIIECLGPIEDFRSIIEAKDGGAKFWSELDSATGEARQILTSNSYGNLESIATRVARIEADLTSAIADKDGVKIALLGAALDRAKSGKPPLTVVEKKPKAATTEPRKPRVAKTVKDILEAFDTKTLANSEGRVVTTIKADDTGKACLVQFDNDDKWISVDPKDLKPVEEGPATQGNLSDASLQSEVA